jgi:hypothetical protein
LSAPLAGKSVWISSQRDQAEVPLFPRLLLFIPLLAEPHRQQIIFRDDLFPADVEFKSSTFSDDVPIPEERSYRKTRPTRQSRRQPPPRRLCFHGVITALDS